MATFLAGLDIGTTGARCMIFDFSGNVKAGVYREYGSYYPEPGWVEQVQAEMIDRAMEVCREAITTAGIDPKEIASLGVSTQRSVTCPIDADGKPVRRSISWQDARAGEQIETLRTQIDADEYYQISGLPLGTTWVISKMLWMREHEPKLFDRTDRFVQMSDIVLKAFGADDFYTDLGSTVFYGVWDVAALRWSQKLMDQFEVSPSQFGKPIAPGTQVGQIPASVAEKTGLAPGTPLCVGAGDQNCSALGMGAVKSGIGTVTLGTCGMAILSTGQPVPGFGGMMSTNHAVPGLWEIEGLTGAAASTYRWFRDEIGPGQIEPSEENDQSSFERLNHLAAQSAPGAGGLLFLPYLATSASPHWNPNARGAFLGLSFAHDRADMARAVMEGVVFEIRDIIQVWLDAGLEVDSLRIGGGATKSQLWNQIQADIYGRPVSQTRCEESTCLGAALLGGVGAGVFSSIEEATDQAVHVTTQVDPDQCRHSLYQERYELFAATYATLAETGIFDRLAKNDN